jgi:hypothetical protein
VLGIAKGFALNYKPWALGLGPRDRSFIMDRPLSRRALLATCALATSIALAACGGGALLLLGFIGSAGGDWLQDDQPGEQPGQVGLQLRSNCGPGGNADCTINIQPVGGQDLYSPAFDLTFTSNLPGCPANGTGRADGARLALSGCFSGAYVNINQALSDSGTVRMFFNFTPPLNQGIWVELQQGMRRFAFSDNSTGCELGTPNVPVAVTLVSADIRNPAGPFETTISSFAVQGGGTAWSGRFVGVSSMRLTRGNEVLELERRQGSAGC